MFELEISDARYWKNCIDAIVSLIDEGHFKITNEGVSLKAMDASSISMVLFSIPNKAFSKYKIEKETSIGLNLDTLSKIMASSNPGEKLVMKESSNRFVIEFIGEKSRRRYKLPMIETDKKESTEPKIIFDSIMEIRGDFLKEMLKHANLVSPYMGFKTEKDLCTVMAKGDAGELEEELKNDGDIIKKMEVKKPLHASFNLDYFTRMVNSAPQDSVISVSLKGEEEKGNGPGPLKLDYKIGEASIVYYLAPYMENY